MNIYIVFVRSHSAMRSYDYQIYIKYISHFIRNLAIIYNYNRNYLLILPSWAFRIYLEGDHNITQLYILWILGT